MPEKKFNLKKAQEVILPAMRKREKQLLREIQREYEDPKQPVPKKQFPKKEKREGKGLLSPEQIKEARAKYAKKL